MWPGVMSSKSSRCLCHFYVPVMMVTARDSLSANNILKEVESEQTMLQKLKKRK
jgi:hypothetical protein